MYNKNRAVEACCITCRSPLSISQSNSNFGQLTSCRVCWKRKWNNAHRDTLHAATRRYYQKDPERWKAYSRNYYQANRGKIKKRERKAALRRQYKLSPEEYSRMEAEQGGLCYLCHKPPKKGTILCVDHCHSEGRVRKLLCFRCNIILGMLEKHGLEWVDRAKAYLKGDAMHHTTVAVQAPHGKSFSVKGLMESNHAGELLSDEEFSRLKVSDVKLARTAGGGFEYEVEFSVDQVPEPVSPTVQ